MDPQASDSVVEVTRSSEGHLFTLPLLFLLRIWKGVALVGVARPTTTRPAAPVAMGTDLQAAGGSREGRGWLAVGLGRQEGEPRTLKRLPRLQVSGGVGEPAPSHCLPTGVANPLRRLSPLEPQQSLPSELPRALNR